MATIVTLELPLKPEAVAGFTASLPEILKDTRKYPGFQSITFATEQGKPGMVFAVEVWDSRAAYEKYLAWRTETGFMDGLSKVLAGTPSIRYFDPIDV